MIKIYDEKYMMKNILIKKYINIKEYNIENKRECL